MDARTKTADTPLWERPDASAIVVIDQRRLPHRLTTATLRSADEVIVAIREMWVRGAPLIGAAGGYGVWLAARAAADEAIDERLDAEAERLIAARPTAANLRWAVELVHASAREGGTPDEKRARALDAARRIVADERERCRRIGEHGLRILTELSAARADAEVNVLTHCNAGWLATLGHGTATAPIYAAHERGLPLHVWVDETRPRNQGAALTAWELAKRGVRHSVIVDNAGGHLMQQGLVDLVIVGADRVAANGDTANKVGTYLKALAARANDIPFYVALPSTTIDAAVASGREIPIEERDPDEVRYLEGLGPNGPARVLLVPPTTGARNPAFDVTPAELVTGFITEDGVYAPAELLPGKRGG